MLLGFLELMGQIIHLSPTGSADPDDASMSEKENMEEKHFIMEWLK